MPLLRCRSPGQPGGWLPVFPIGEVDFGNHQSAPPGLRTTRPGSAKRASSFIGLATRSCRAKATAKPAIDRARRKGEGQRAAAACPRRERRAKRLGSRGDSNCCRRRSPAHPDRAVGDRSTVTIRDVLECLVGPRQVDDLVAISLDGPPSAARRSVSRTPAGVRCGA